MTRPSRTVSHFAKGHGAENDFIVLPDPRGHLALPPAEVTRLCDRRAGIGADGILRAVRCTAEPEASAMAADAEWFMDYRNADGSKGAMCGNGLRVLARYLVDTGLCPPGTLTVATRAGTRQAHVPHRSPDFEGDVSVRMGCPRLPGPDGITVTVAERRWSALHVDMGNPHAVVFVDDLAHAGDLATAPTVEPADAYPHGVTVEFVIPRAPGHLALRVYERGVGETRACGTGACAAVAAAVLCHGTRSAAASYTVDVPGGRLRIELLADGSMDLTGPAEIVAHGTTALTPVSASRRAVVC
ncbi:diaminopimelate epimerase [Streptomyces sp. NBC_01750]|uniref:diaminopimelate epimerase n=1 Tax=Streptomyces sp. NBC_01750 TaxID=2975928 RepID=UPI002DDBF108|nr:diaminopimelate epimerase [Streptomyces sp. NBC_01750]WSD38091.1 diaminopimelate epimerase [Streptomyces sp. NBC_01750]